MSIPKSHTGGGKTPRSVGNKTGPANTRVVSPSGAAHIGRSVGNHSSETGDMRRPADPVYLDTKRDVPMGNAVALNVGKGGPGAGRTVSRSGSQGTHGSLNPGRPEPVPGAGGSGPSSFGFKGDR